MREILDHAEVIEEKTRFPRSFYWVTGVMIASYIWHHLQDPYLLTIMFERFMWNEWDLFLTAFVINFVATPLAFILLLMKKRSGWLLTVVFLVYQVAFLIINWIDKPAMIVIDYLPNSIPFVIITLVYIIYACFSRIRKTYNVSLLTAIALIVLGILMALVEDKLRAYYFSMPEHPIY